MSSRKHPWLAWSALLTIAALALVWMVRDRFRAREPLLAAPRAPTALEPAVRDAGATPLPKPRGAKPPPRKSTGACESGASQRCHQGDVWSLDSCGKLEEKLDECGPRACRDGACERQDPEPCREPPEGRCVGSSVRLCLAGRTLKVDCGARGLECVYGEEGAQCVPPIPADQRCSGPPRCEGNVLVHCEAGRIAREDCEEERGRCVKPRDGSFASCVLAVPDLAPLRLGCDACGCPDDNERGESECDALDEDQDGLVDEGLDCGPIPILAFVIADGAGETSHAPEDVQIEIERANQLFAQSAANAPSFALGELVVVRDAALLDVDSEELNQLARDPRLHPARDEPYIPLVFTDRILLDGDTPKPGVSTLPNGTCGGMQEGVGPEVGAVVVAKGRSLTTVTHEIGHFLGLCHTHATRTGAPLAIQSDVGAQAGELCAPSCRGQGDGVCDTAFDPGPEQCIYDTECRTHCNTGDEPDPTNLMSYYTACRRRFSPEQVALMQHTVALRRGWQRCITGECVCEPGKASCPAGMNCRPVVLAQGEHEFRCGLDGPRRAGADCEHTSDCGHDTVCLTEQSSGHQRCVRPCLASGPGCTCTRVSNELSVCVEDIGGGA